MSKVKTMNMQEIFDKSVGGVIAQGRKSGQMGSCKYRSHDGTKCAVGHLITDEAYDYSHEGLSVNHADVRGMLAASGIDTINADFLDMANQLQVAHDWAGDKHFIDEFKDKAKETAKSFDLKWNFK